MAKSKKKTVVNEKTVRIACEGAANVPIDELTDLQGTLKDLPEIKYQKLRTLLLKLGFSFAVSAWKHEGKVFIIDAHQRVAALRRMRDEEGFAIPDLPVCWVEAANRTEAAEKVLAATSQFGEITYQGLFDFMKEFELDMPLVNFEFSFPEIDMDRFTKTFFPEEKKVEFTVKAKPPETPVEPGEVHVECPKCGYRLTDDNIAFGARGEA